MYANYFDQYRTKLEDAVVWWKMLLLFISQFSSLLANTESHARAKRKFFFQHKRTHTLIFHSFILPYLPLVLHTFKHNNKHSLFLSQFLATSESQQKKTQKENSSNIQFEFSTCCQYFDCQKCLRVYFLLLFLHWRLIFDTVVVAHSHPTAHRSNRDGNTQK